MSHENIKSMGSGQPLEKIIKIKKDTCTIIVRHGGKNKKLTIYDIDPIIELTLSESLRVVEGVVKFINKQANDGLQQQIRTNKDKENQETVNGLRNCILTNENKHTLFWDKDALDRFLAEEIIRHRD